MNTASNEFPLHLPFSPEFMLVLFTLLLLVIIWIIAIKGYALWHAARGNQMWWFVALLVINTCGILEIIYLVWFRQKTIDTQSTNISHTPATNSSPQV